VKMDIKNAYCPVIYNTLHKHGKEHTAAKCWRSDILFTMFNSPSITANGTPQKKKFLVDAI